MIWDDSALIDAYNVAVEQYKARKERLASAMLTHHCHDRLSMHLAPNFNVVARVQPRGTLRVRILTHARCELHSTFH